MRLALLALLLAVASCAMAQKPRNDWYRSSLVNIHCDNHSGLLGKGVPPDELLEAFRSVPVTMVQVSAQSNGYATYPTKVGLNNPNADGYDTLATFKTVTQKLGKKLCIYMSVDRRPLQVKDHPEWAMRTAKGEITINGDPCVCNRPNRDKRGYLYEQFLPQIKEIIARYDPDGFWFDGDYILTKPCWCDNCLREWKADTGQDAPRDEASPLWAKWCDWHYQRFHEYRRLVAETIHTASKRAMYTSNWSWSHKPEPMPDWADTLTGDCGSIRQLPAVVMRWGAQQKIPWDIMSYAAPYRALTRVYSPQRTFQEGALTMAHGGQWFAWTVGGDLPPSAIEMTRRMAQFVRDRAPALGPSTSLSQVAVLDSETTWLAQGRKWDTTVAGNAARCLQEARYFTDIVNEETLRQGLAPYRVVVLPMGNALAPETMQWLEAFVRQGGVLLVCGDGLRDDGLLGLKRTARQANKPAAIRIGDRSCWMLGSWDVTPGTAQTLLSFADGRPALTVHTLGQGKVAYLATDQVLYPQDEALLGALKALGCGPSYGAVANAGLAPLLCTLRQKQGQIVLHIVDMSSRVGGRMTDLNADDYTDLNPELRNVRVWLPLQGEARLLAAYPALSGATVTRQGEFLAVRLEYLKDHAAVVLGYDAPPQFGLCGQNVPETLGDFHPLDPKTSGFSEDFEDLAVGSRPATPWQSWNRDAATVAVSDQNPAAGKRCVKFTDAAGCSFWPFMHRSVTPFRTGRARLTFDVRVDGADCLLEVRYEGKGAGPLARFNHDGKLSTTAGEAMAFPLGQWLHVQCDFALGVEKPAYTLTVTAPGQEPKVFADLKYATEWFFLCDSVYFVGSGDTPGSFSLDSIRFERLPD
ncbi:alpha-L-fucosidase [bacterium]|nr:alpha-L-fucosidase [bacterium]